MKKTLSFLLAFTLGTAAVADHTVTMRTTFADPSAQGMKMTSVTRTKNNRQRIEDTTDMGQFKMVMVRLTMCDLEQEAQIDPDAKIYTVRSLRPGASSESGEPAKTKPGTGKYVTKVKVEDKGVEKVAQVDARHWIVDTDMTSSGCIGDHKYKTRREFWTSALPAFSCPILNGTWKNADYDGCKVTNEITGDVDKFYQSMKNQVVKEITYVDGKAQMTRELVDFSTAELDQALFSLDGYKKVTDAEFQAAQQQKMMQMYMPK